VRTITLITRKGEFSNVTSVPAGVCRQVLHDGLIRRGALLLPERAAVCVLAEEDEPSQE
jgi:hypothetical protein